MAHQAIPDIPNIKAHWERRSDPLPYLIVPMSDGTEVRYNAECPQPGFVRAMDNIKNMVVGYKNDPEPLRQASESHD